MPTSLDKSDLIRFESILNNSLKLVIPFSSYCLYFPKEIPKGMQQGQDIIPLIEKDRALLPLVMDNEFLGIFLAKGINSSKLKSIRDHLKSIVSLALDKIVLHKMCMLDELTNLYSRERFISLIENEIEAVIESITPGPGATMDNGPSHHSACFCVMVFNLDRFRKVNNTFGFAFGDKILSEISQNIQEIIPEQAVPARLDNDTFALFWPQTSSHKCHELGSKIVKKISELIFEYDVSGEKVSITMSGGASFFPHDLKGSEFRKSSFELSRVVLQKAKQSMEIAKENGRNRIYSFGHLLSQGGTVMEKLPLDRLVINLGKNVDACEGQKFMVWSSKYNGNSEIFKESDKTSLGHYPPIHKGEVTVLEVQDRISIAEVLYLNDPSWKIEPGDKLSLMSEKDSLLEKEGINGEEKPKKDILTGLYSYRDFLSLWSRNRGQSESFVMAMLKVQDTFKKSAQRIESENLIQEIVKSLNRRMKSPPLSGRYSSTCIVFYTAQDGIDEVQEILRQLNAELKERFEIIFQAAISKYPCLNFSRIHTLENCRKALEHATLLDFPHVAVFDTLTLTISADRLFSQGDTFAAMEEYKSALSADETNIIARNSLAICYARLGRLELARKHFQEIIIQDEQNIMAWYNFACVCLKQGEIDDAQKGFKKCLEIDDKHAFSLFRLGQLAENSEFFDKAEKYYNQARETEMGLNMAPRHLARLNWKKGNKEEAREFLHQALINNPRDAFSLNLMARVYLESGDDPQIAESLGRQSVALRPDVASFWIDLSETLKAQGKDEQALKAKARAFV